MKKYRSTVFGLIATAAIMVSATPAMAGKVDIDVNIGVPVVPAPVMVQPRPVYVEPRPVYVEPKPVYVQPRTVVVREPVYVEREGEHWDCRKHKCKEKWDKHRDHDHGRGHGRGRGHGHDD